MFIFGLVLNIADYAVFFFNCLENENQNIHVTVLLTP